MEQIRGPSHAIYNGKSLENIPHGHLALAGMGSGSSQAPLLAPMPLSSFPLNMAWLAFAHMLCFLQGQSKKENHLACNLRTFFFF